MKRPSPPGTNIDMARMTNWISDFSGYRHSITEDRIDRWLNQFSEDHRDLAARILDCVDFITYEQMMEAFRSILNGLEGWDKEKDRRRGKWRFVAFSVSAGESGDTMLHKFRLANGLNGRQYNALFIHMSELLKEKLGPEDTVVFVDDFSGTGKQASDAWSTIISELLPESPKTYLVLIVASASAREKINNETGLTPVHYIELSDNHNIFSSACRHFTQDEKENILTYCKKADRRNPRGQGDCGFVIVFAHTCPNNSIPILHVSHPNWQGLFRRYD